MKALIVAIIGASGSGTSLLAERVASILRWPFASFGAHVRSRACALGKSVSRRDLQDLGLELVSNPTAFCEEVLRASLWRPGQSLIIDGVRHVEIAKSLERLLGTDLVTIYIDADDQDRQQRLESLCELDGQGLLPIDLHPVEKEVLDFQTSALKLVRDSADLDQVDELVEFLLNLAQVPPTDAWVSSDGLVRIPRSIRKAFHIAPGDRLHFSVKDNSIVLIRTLDEDRIRSAVGRLKQELEGVDPHDLVRQLRKID